MSSSTKRPSNEPVKSAFEQRRDLVTGRWHLLASGREARPNEFSQPATLTAPVRSHCEFCAGHEHETTPTLAQYAIAPAKSGDTWQVRVVSNLYPIVDPQGQKPHDSPLSDPTEPTRPSVGQHEVIIESARHDRSLTDLSEEEVALVLRAYQDRLGAVRADGRWSNAILFKNSGRDAGMSREHVHSQLLATPHRFPILELEMAGAQAFLESQGECVFCHLVRDELRKEERLIAVGRELVAYCPFASRTAYEIWIVPRSHQPCFSQISAATQRELAKLLQQVLQRIHSHLGPIAYNYFLHSIPFDSRREDHYHWHIEIIPRLSRLAGLEWGTGVSVNTVSPEAAALQLRQERKR